MSTSRPSKTPLLSLALDKRADEPAYHQIYDQIRLAILAGRLRPGTRLPSSRGLAAELGVSRNTVLTAFDMLGQEGYTEGGIGSGTRVSAVLPDELLSARGAKPKGRQERGATAGPAPRISGLAARLDSMRQRTRSDQRAFRPGLPEVEQFPWNVWGRLAGRLWRHPPRSGVGGGALAGHQGLRDAIAGYVAAVRGVNCSGEQVMITSGAQQGLDLIARLLLEPGDQVWMEDPGYAGMRGAFAATGAEIVALPVDADGLDVAAGRARAPEARLCAVTPSHQYPTGATMSLARRLELLDWARGAGSWILEDDYDSEYRYAGKPLAALQGLDDGGRVIYVGTFSKVLFPGLRLGYAILPEALVPPFLAMRSVLDDAPALGLQPVLADFIAEGHFAAHVRRTRALYAERQVHFLAALKRHCAGMLVAQPDEAGMHLVVGLDPRLKLSDRAAAARADAAGISAPALSSYYAGGSAKSGAQRQGLVLGYTGFSERETDDGLALLAAALG
jgi:GntR family transcriptional regulator/MocR family aminotransferase